MLRNMKCPPIVASALPARIIPLLVSTYVSSKICTGVAGWTYSMRTGKHCEYVIVDIKEK